MANPISTKSPDLRFIGVSVGNSAARLAKTAYHLEADEFEEPELRPFENNAFIPALVVASLPAEQTLTKRRDLPKLIASLGDAWTIEKDLVERFGVDPANEMVGRYMKAMADRLYKETCAWLKFANFDPGRYLVSVGIPSDWDRSSPPAQALQAAFQASGFTTLRIVPDAVAAVYFHLHTPHDRLPYHKSHAQAWLVIDVGAKLTRVTCVEKPAGTADLRVRSVASLQWGGDLIDKALYDKLLRPNYWLANSPPNEKQKSILLEMLCDLKEKYSARAARSSASINFQFEGVRDPVELSQTDFESESLGQPLIRRFQNLLDDPRLQSPHGAPGFDRVLLVGGGANWSFVQEAARFVWKNKCIVSDNPAAAVAKGLALVGTGFEPADTLDTRSDLASSPGIGTEKPDVALVAIVPPPHLRAQLNTNARSGPDKRYPVTGQLLAGQQAVVVGRNETNTWWYIENPALPNNYFWVTAETTQLIGDPSQVRVYAMPPDSEAAHPPTDDKHTRARRLILWCTLIGTAVALVVSPIPGASWPFLTALELFMFVRIATVFYGYKVTSGTVLLLTAFLVVLSTVLTLVVGDVIGTLAWLIGLGWLVKMVVAGLVIWGLGESVIFILDQIGQSPT